jgi:uncharacterized protein (DUF952 family)
MRGFLRESAGDVPDWEGTAAKLRQEAEAAGTEEARAAALGRLGEHLRVSPVHLNEAIDLLQEAVRLAGAADRPGTVVANRIRLAIAFQYAERHEEAVRCHMEAIDAVRADGDLAGLEDFAHQHLGKCLAEMGRIEEARACLMAALRLRRSRGVEELVTSTLTALERLEVTRIFHIATERDWARTKEEGAYRAPSLASEGFIHCSTANQVPGVAVRLFRGEAGLVLLELDALLLLPRLRYENCDGGDEGFPHVYGTIPLEAVLRAVPFAC